MYVCHSQGNKGNKNFFSLFSYTEQVVASSMRQEGKKIYMTTMCVCVCVCLFCFVYVLCLRSHIRRCTADDGTYTTLSKRKEKADTRYCLLFHIVSFLSLHIHHHQHSTHTHTHIHSYYCLIRTHCVKDKQAGKAEQSSIYIYIHI
jgi:hypothetical protein